MNIIDSIIIVILIAGVIAGLRSGVLKLSVSLIGTLLVIILAWILKNPVAEFLYENMPFFNFSGTIEGVTVLNILLYETAAFLIVCTVLGIILNIILKITGIIEKVFNATIVLGLVSKLLGAVLGFAQAYVILFIILFFFKQPFINLTGVNDSKLSNFILNNTPFLGDAVKETNDTLEEIYVLKDKYKETRNKNDFNKEALDIFLKNKIITVNSVKILKDKNKLKFRGLDSLIEKYGE